jgi:hypothetical protein
MGVFDARLPSRARQPIAAAHLLFLHLLQLAAG